MLVGTNGLSNPYFLPRSSLSSHLSVTVPFLLLGAQRLTRLHQSVSSCTNSNSNNLEVHAGENAKPPLSLRLPMDGDTTVGIAEPRYVS